MMHQVDNTNIEPEKAVLVGLVTLNQTEEQLMEYLDELAFLAEKTRGSQAVCGSQRDRYRHLRR
jgi:GTP-binding protein HflX